MLVIVEGGKREKYLRFVYVFELRIKESQVCNFGQYWNTMSLYASCK